MLYKKKDILIERKRLNTREKVRTIFMRTVCIQQVSYNPVWVREKKKIQSFGIIIKKADYILAILKGMKMLYKFIDI